MPRIRIFCVPFAFLAFLAAPLFAQADMVLVEGGTFQMGSDLIEDNAKPVHEVTVGSFYMARYEVTQKEWAEVMGSSPSYFRGDTLPVEQISWYEAVEYCNRLSLKEGLAPAYRGSGDDIVCDFDASGFRLPTEAEWEYAARGGNKEAYPYEYSGGDNLDEVAWYWENSKGRTHPVGTKQPNALGIYDMSGNVWEWCWDRLGSYRGENQTNPTGYSGLGSTRTHRVHRGGSWIFNAPCARCAYRNHHFSSGRGEFLGFRVVRSRR
jgi:formylglycine-generating enzyme required for sulfatase activity